MFATATTVLFTLAGCGPYGASQSMAHEPPSPTLYLDRSGITIITVTTHRRKQNPSWFKYIASIEANVEVIGCHYGPRSFHRDDHGHSGEGMFFARPSIRIFGRGVPSSFF